MVFECAFPYTVIIISVKFPLCIFNQPVTEYDVKL